MCYLFFLLSGFIIAQAVYIAGIKEADPDAGLANLAIGIASAIIIVLGVGYSIASIIPLILKTLNIFFEKKAFSALSIPFDLLFILVNALIIISAITDDGEGKLVAILVSLALLAIAVLAFVLNILALKKKPAKALPDCQAEEVQAEE